MYLRLRKSISVSDSLNQYILVSTNVTLQIPWQYISIELDFSSELDLIQPVDVTVGL